MQRNGATAPGLTALLALAAPAWARPAGGPAMMSAVAAAARPPALRVQADACASLWEERNGIYKSADYCFITRRAIATFGNAGRQYDIEAGALLSHRQRMRINDIRAAGRRPGCAP